MNTAHNPRVEIDASIFNPYSKDFIRNPDPTWQILIRDYPIAWHRDLQMWIVSSHELCDRILKDARFSPNFRVWELAPPPKPEDQKTDFDRAFEKGFFAVGPQAHLRLRKLTMPAFSKPVMSQIDAKIRDLIIGCFDAIGDAEEFDVYQALAVKIPARSIARMVGVPTDLEDFFHEFAVNVIKSTRINLSAKEREASMHKTLPGFKYFRDEIARRRALSHPGDDFLGSLIAASDAGSQLDDDEILSVVFALITAGSDTATDLHTYLLYALLSHPDQFELLKQRPELMENAIIECLRWGSFGKVPFFRFATEDIEFAGQLIKKGQAIGVNIQAAWHDPAKWEDPLKLDITRRLDGNIVFGAGAHFCIGTYLVRVQGSLMLQEFMRRYPNATLADGDGRIDYEWTHHNARRINRLIVKTNRVAARKAA
ncbi:Cytochrome P450 [Fontimonas thermophila]|uniref:Cytochrome P450 n=1 Tax=Fontimonas thermophila TaxID=1076937 RepID=A0A1I2J8M2_9GAMM|nr:cytochrome P450 [Fontimonas thermophila]SFF51085.1 Cytochrome P450 [Fontimonas thermophila]